MINLFVRLAATVLGAIVLTLFAGRLLGVDPLEQSVKTLGGHARLIASDIAETAPSERRDYAARLKKRLGYPVSLEPLRQGASPRAEQRGFEVFVIAAVPRTEGQIALGPLPGRPGARLIQIFAVAFCLSLLAAILLIRPIGKRIRSIELLSMRMSAGDFKARIRRQEGDFFDRVSATLNSLADRIGQLLNDERDLLRTVAHEVRAPIARMRFRVDKVQRHASEELKKDATGLVNDLAQVDKLFEELLTYVAFDEFDQDRPKLTTSEFAVRQAVERVMDEVTDTNDEVEVTIEGPADVQIEANLKLFERSVTNLLLNAIAYGGPKIDVKLRHVSEHCIVDVQDSGPGIPELDRPEVIKPFVRLNTKKKKGTGLGLAIVSRIMRLHGGAFYIMDAPGGGASIQLVWKLEPVLSEQDRDHERLLERV